MNNIRRDMPVHDAGCQASLLPAFLQSAVASCQAWAFPCQAEASLLPVHSVLAPKTWDTRSTNSISLTFMPCARHDLTSLHVLDDNNVCTVIDTSAVMHNVIMQGALTTSQRTVKQHTCMGASNIFKISAADFFGGSAAAGVRSLAGCDGL